MTRPNRPLARTLTQRLIMIAAGIVALNIAVVGAYYGSDRRALEAELIADVTARLGAALNGTQLPVDARARDIIAEYPESYAFALIDSTGNVTDAMNRSLIPPSAIDLYADDWVTAVDMPMGRLLYAGHEFRDRTDGLRVVFVMTSDPANLLRQAFLSEFREHVWMPILPMALLLIAASAILIRRELAPVARAAAWARTIRPGAMMPPPSGPMPTEVADLIETTQRALERLAAALAAETRHAAEAAHALRTPVAVLVARLDALPPGEIRDRLRADLAALSRTVQQVLAASRSEMLTVPEDAALDLRRPAETVTAALAPFAFGKGVEFSLSICVATLGVESREVGVMFLVFFPVPYVEASSSMMLPSKWQRISVSASGIQMELGLAALATLVWAVAEPGTLRATAFNIMLIGGHPPCSSTAIRCCASTVISSLPICSRSPISGSVQTGTSGITASATS